MIPIVFSAIHIVILLPFLLFLSLPSSSFSSHFSKQPPFPHQIALLSSTFCICVHLPSQEVQPFPISLIRSLYPANSHSIVLHAPLLSGVLSYSPIFCSNYSLCAHIWRFGAKSLQWERACDICLSGSQLPQSIWSFLVLPIHLHGFIFLYRLIFHSVYIYIYIYNIFIIHLLVVGHLSFFYSLPIVNRQQWTWLSKFLWSTMLSTLGELPRSDRAGSCTRSNFSFLQFSILTSVVAAPICTLTSSPSPSPY